MYTVAVDLSEFHRKVARTGEELRLSARDAVTTAARAGAAHAKQVGPFKDRTFKLRTGIVARFLESGANGTTWEILSPMFYSKWVDKGTSRSRAYPFMTPAELKARQVLAQQLPVILSGRLRRVW